RVDVLDRELLAVQGQRPRDRPVAGIHGRFFRGLARARRVCEGRHRGRESDSGRDEGENRNPEDAHEWPLWSRIWPPLLRQPVTSSPLDHATTRLKTCVWASAGRAFHAGPRDSSLPNRVSLITVVVYG